MDALHQLYRWKLPSDISDFKLSSLMNLLMLSIIPYVFSTVFLTFAAGLKEVKKASTSPTCPDCINVEVSVANIVPPDVMNDNLTVLILPRVHHMGSSACATKSHCLWYCVRYFFVKILFLPLVTSACCSNGLVFVGMTKCSE